MGDDEGWEASMAANAAAVGDRKQAKLDFAASLHGPRARGERSTDRTALVGVECAACGLEHLPQMRRPYGTAEPVESFWCDSAETWMSREEVTE